MQEQTDSAPIQRPIPLGRVRSKLCEVRGCHSNSLRNPELLFVGVPGHSFPERRFVWLALMQAARDKKRSYVCSLHFKIPDDFRDFHEFISAPPGYKRQLMVKKGVVPHLNMPPSNTGLPPLTDRWQMTLPVTLTANHQMERAAAAAAEKNASARFHPQTIAGRSLHQHVPTQVTPQRIPYTPRTSNEKRQISRAIQTDAKSAIIAGHRSIRPSLQYCRLCFKRYDLEPIFAGDQTLIEPDLIDKIYGSLGIMITAECDFPSSICSGCYESVYDFVKFRELIRKNDRSLWESSTGSQMEIDSVNSPIQPLTSVRKKITELKQPPFRIQNAAVSKGVPTRITTTTTTTQQKVQNEDSLLTVGRVEDIETYERRQKDIERNQPREQRIQDTLIPVPYRRRPMVDPLENIPQSANRTVGTETPAQGVQLGDRFVPVTFIQVPNDVDEANDESDESNAPKLENVSISDDSEPSPAKQPKNSDEKQEVNNQKTKETFPSTQTADSAAPSADVLQAVRLISKTALEAASKHRTSSRITKPPSRIIADNSVSRVLKVIQSDQKKSPEEPKPPPKIRIMPKVIRGIKFPGTLTTLFSGKKKKELKLMQPVVVVSKITGKIENIKPKEAPKDLKSIESPQLPETSKVKEPEQNSNSVQKKLKENDIPAKDIPTRNAPKVAPTKVSSTKVSSTKDAPPKESSTKDAPVTSPRTSRARKVPLKFKDTVGFPMPKIILVKPDPDAEVERTQPANVKAKPKISSSRESGATVAAKKSQVIEEPTPEENTTRSSGRLRKDSPVEVHPKPSPKPISRPTKRKSDSMASETVDRGEPVAIKPSKVEKLVKDKGQTSQHQPHVKANGSGKSVPAKIPKRKVEETTTPAVISSQDWKCPFCSDRIFDQKKGLVKHLRKRHGMDYALVRQRLAIYGGNWR